jgi:hypothetical protein
VEIGAEDASEVKNDDHDNDRTDADNQQQGAAILHSTPLGDVSASSGDQSRTCSHDGVGNDEQRTQRGNQQIRRGLLQHRSCERAATCARQELADGRRHSDHGHLNEQQPHHQADGRSDLTADGRANPDPNRRPECGCGSADAGGDSDPTRGAASCSRCSCSCDAMSPASRNIDTSPKSVRTGEVHSWLESPPRRPTSSAAPQREGSDLVSSRQTSPGQRLAVLALVQSEMDTVGASQPVPSSTPATRLLGSEAGTRAVLACSANRPHAM